MSRKKHTHQTKSEAHAEEVILAEAPPAEGASEAAAATAEAVESGVRGRVTRLVKGAESLAKKRIAGTRAELMIDAIPVRLEKLLDAALDKVGLVRKAKLEGGAAKPAPTEAAAPMGAEPQAA